MTIRLLLLSDIHGNYPALKAVAEALDPTTFQYIINSGDSIVYAPFPNETLQWLYRHNAISILGNTDKKVLKILKGKSFKKPHKAEKRIMYSSTAKVLKKNNRKYLYTLPKSKKLQLPVIPELAEKKTLTIGIFHGSPADPNEFLFANTPDNRFQQLAEASNCDVVITGHSHTPYSKSVGETTFINPGSVGRMFDKDPRASCATLEISADKLTIQHFRIRYQIDEVIAQLNEEKLPSIYAKMYKNGEKLN